MSRPRLLVLRALYLGDFLTGVPAYRALRRAYPDHETVLAAPAPLAPLVPLTGAFDRHLPAGELEPLDWAGPPPDVAVDLHGRGWRSHTLLERLRPGRLIAFDADDRPDGPPGPAATAGPPRPGGAPVRWRAGEHEVERWCRLLVEHGIPADPTDLLLPLPLPAPPAGGARSPGSRRPADRRGVPADPWAGTRALPGLPGLPAGRPGAAPGERGYVVVHPGAAAPARRWPMERFAAVARELASAGRHVVVTGGADEEYLAAEVVRQADLPAAALLAGRTDLAALARVVAGADLVVCGDTGTAHLASAFARPSVVLFGPVPPREWGPPPRPFHVALHAAPDGYRGDPHGAVTDPALEALGVPEVLDACARALAAADARARPAAAAPPGPLRPPPPLTRVPGPTP
ncbi:glycosyltransferase family 9 protein [Allostreptomyces psammosilenae]|uniref:ADP-heptose:LPS heptosyltransferase n=1 Tax=Allostreptomyces psammosilenae TaxID=1892865 RepID=A0A853A0S7_9ACTN|nr:glycosyltransferase family 9 protein [Allostreptomyces psammosilenae]NYI04112.1 ADP-heptose:LPS heptosyltransferase [Allostreptomyces psammosilenae]